MATKAHYEGHSASTYESAYFYSPGEYMDHLAQLVQGRLGLGGSATSSSDATTTTSTKRRILDIGGGTGNFTKLLVSDCSPLVVEAIVVDPFLEETSLNGETSKDAVKFVKASAETLAQPNSSGEWWRQSYHQVLMKEVIHHLEDSKDRIGVFKGIARELSAMNNDDPGILIVTRPQVDIDYPLWDEARQVWADHQPSATELQAELEQAGFSNISCTIEAYPCSIELERWLVMVQGRFWSTFSNFSDDELEEACERLRRDETHRVDDNGVICFEDRLVFISASN